MSLVVNPYHLDDDDDDRIFHFEKKINKFNFFYFEIVDQEF